MKITKGVTRIALIFNNIVIKIPNFTYSWQNFLTGILCNINERDTWVWSDNTKKDLLAPVLWTCPGGWILIMQKADVERHIQEVRRNPLSPNLSLLQEVEQRYAPWLDNQLSGDDKPDNYGYIDNKLVKIDYGSKDYLY